MEMEIAISEMDAKLKEFTVLKSPLLHNLYPSSEKKLVQEMRSLVARFFNK